MRGRGRGGPKKVSLAVRAAAYQQHMAQKLFASPDPIVKPRSPSPPKPKVRPQPKKAVPVPTSTIFESNSVADKRQRYKRKLTLAEQLGIVEPPPAPLTDEQFETVKIDAEKRGFYDQTCPICMEKFGPDNLVLLSCSHLLHATCLMSFRRFTRGQEHLCPVCRSPYEFVEVHAETAYHHKCAREIQRVFRGFLVRDRVGREAPPGSMLHRKWVIAKAQGASGKLIKAMDHQSDAIDAMLSALDADLEYSRSIMRAMEERERIVDWQEIKQKAIDRKQVECPVCLREMDPDETEVTSCGHSFHQKCLESWLKFCENQNKAATCPVCRAVFQHQPMVERPEGEEPPKKQPEKKKPKPKTVKPPERKRWR